MAQIATNFGVGGAQLTPAGSAGAPSLAQALRDIADDLGDSAGRLAAWSAALTVTAHVVTLPRAGVPVAVEGTVGTAAGVKAIQHSGTPSAGFVTVAFTSGVATLTFNAVDAITACRVLMTPAPATVRTTKV